MPVRLFRAHIPHRFRFHLLHADDHARIRLKRVCSKDGQEVPLNETVRGLQLSPDEFVVITNAELAALSDRGSRRIAIEDFVGQGEIDPIFFERTYYVVPDEGAEDAYALVYRAMVARDRVAVARITMRLKQHLCALRPARGMLVLSTMRYMDELVSPSDLKMPDLDGHASRRELALAGQLIDLMSTRFRPHHYRDTFRDELAAILKQKSAGRVPLRPEEETVSSSEDVESALRRSIARARRVPHRLVSRPETGGGEDNEPLPVTH